MKFSPGDKVKVIEGATFNWGELKVGEIFEVRATGFLMDDPSNPGVALNHPKTPGMFYERRFVIHNPLVDDTRAYLEAITEFQS